MDIKKVIVGLLCFVLTLGTAKATAQVITSVPSTTENTRFTHSISTGRAILAKF